MPPSASSTSTAAGACAEWPRRLFWVGVAWGERTVLRGVGMPPQLRDELRKFRKTTSIDAGSFGTDEENCDTGSISHDVAECEGLFRHESPAAWTAFGAWSSYEPGAAFLESLTAKISQQATASTTNLNDNNNLFAKNTQQA
ncbi:hypothetical protein VTN49DRAFT_5846 [Thermomyces lanuginosus]|uniref:uncharacterized protein n=1 Tax=Thermomyces lanuginosus TaxID=5541 RepID=UPI00374408D5